MNITLYLCKQTQTHPNLLTCIQNSNVPQTLQNPPLQVVDIPLFFDVKEPFIARNIGLISSVSNIKIQFNYILYLYLYAALTPSCCIMFPAPVSAVWDISIHHKQILVHNNSEAVVRTWISTIQQLQCS